MPRRERRSGVRFIEDDRDRSLTFFKRRSGLFKAASDLSTLTGAKAALVLESESGRFSSFGTPEASPIVDAFLLGNSPTELDTDEEKKAKITNLQNEVFQLEKDKAIEEKRRKKNMAQTKNIQETSKIAKYVYGNVEDLDATELFEVYRELSRIKQEINDRLPTLFHENNVEAGGRLRDPSLLQPTWWRSMPPQVVTPPKCSLWAPTQDSFQQYPWSSSSYPVLARSGSSLPDSVVLPSLQVPPKSLQQHPLAPHVTSNVQLQAPNMPPLKEVHPYSHHFQGIDINGNNSPSLFISPRLSSPTPQPSVDSSPLSLSLQPSAPLQESQQLPFDVQNYNSVQQSQNYANVGSTSIHSHQPFYNNLLPGLNVELGSVSGSGGHVDSGHSKRFGFSGPQQGDGFSGVMPEPSSARDNSGDGDARSNLGGLNFPWY